MFYFHTTHKRFQTAYASGSFPGDISWYYVHRFDNFEVFASQLQTNASQSLRSSTSRHPYRSSKNSNSAIASSSTNSQLTAPSVLICAWVRWLDTIYLVPEIWRFFLTPDEHITCLNIRQNIWDLHPNLDLRRFMVVGERMILMGSKGPDGNSVSETGDDSTSDTDSDTDDSGVVCDTYVDIPVRQLVLSSRPQRQ
jgi:hypothetical protein